MRKPEGVDLLITVQIAMAVLAIPSGLILLADPSGSLIGGSSVLSRINSAVGVVTDFTPVGIWLLAVYGILPIVLAVGLVMRKRWAWKVTAVLGAVEILWIVAELALFYDLGFNPMYPLIGGIGALTLFSSLYAPVRRYFTDVT